MSKDRRKEMVKKLEAMLKKYETYKTGIKTLQTQLDYIMPNITVDYTLTSEGSTGTFNIKSDTEKYAIDRIESKRAISIHEDMERYRMIVNSIDEAMKDLDEIEAKFVEYRYFKDYSMIQVSLKLERNEKYLYEVKNRVFDKLLISLRGLIHF